MDDALALAALAVWLFWVALLARFVISVIASFARSWTPHGPTLLAAEGVYTVTDPLIKPLRRLLPLVNLGGMRLDLTLMVAMLAVYFVMILLW